MTFNTYLQDMNLKQELEIRWFINQYSDEKLFDIYDKWWQSFYCWYDPSADSLTIWNFVTLMASVNLMKKWNKFYLLIWWATGMIWDPGWKDQERNFLDEETLRYNQDKITIQVKLLLENIKKLSWYDLNFEVVNNYDFYKNMTVLDYLRKVGKYITVNNMIKKETVQRRIEDPDKSISYTEFSYMLLQWWDFVELYKSKNIQLQLAWWDQWGNAVTWLEMIRKIIDKEAYALTTPLIVDSNWKKFWKSEWNAVWLDPQKNSPYFVYQFFINTPDNDVKRYLNLFTLLDIDNIDSIIGQHKECPELRYGQKQLASYIVEAIFWQEASRQAQTISEILFWQENKITLIEKMNDDDLIALYNETGGAIINKLPIWVLDLMVESKLVSSKWEWRKMIESWAIYLNESKLEDSTIDIDRSNLISWKTILLRKGKKTYKTIIYR